MANSQLQGRSWNIPEELYGHLNRTMKAYKGDTTVDGYKRLKGLLEKPTVSYEQLKRIKNFFDNHQTSNVDYMDDKKQDTEFILNGGRKMRHWVDYMLGTARDNVEKIKDVKKDSGTAIGNTHIKTHDKMGLPTSSVKPHSTSDLKLKKESYIDIYNREKKLFEDTITIFNKNKKLWQIEDQ